MFRSSVAAVLTAAALTVTVVGAVAGCTGSAGPTSGTPTATGRPADLTALRTEATVAYRRYLDAQSAELVARGQEFADAVKAGAVDRAKSLFTVARAPYERIKPVTRPFRDLDRRLDGAEDDERDPGVAWTGFHRLEKDLWVDGLQPDSGGVADQLMTDLMEVRTRVATLPLSVGDLGDNATGLLDGVVVEKIRGQEDRYSHTDLWDFQANVEGARAALTALRPVLDAKDPTLGPLLDARFAAVDAVLAKYRVGDGFMSYVQLAPDDIKRMTEAVDALSEPVSQVAGVVTS